MFNSTLFLATRRNSTYGKINTIGLVAGSAYLTYIFYTTPLDARGLASILVLIYSLQTINSIHIKHKIFVLRSNKNS